MDQEDFDKVVRIAVNAARAGGGGQITIEGIARIAAALIIAYPDELAGAEEK